jgi:hypothetical protein
MQNFLGSTFFGFILLVAGIALVTSLLGTTISTPDNAVVYFNDLDRTFYPEPCVTNDTYAQNNNRLRVGDYLEVSENDYTQSTDCPLVLTQKGKNMFLTFLTSLGFLSPLESRWDEKGHWKY